MDLPSIVFVSVTLKRVAIWISCL